MSLAKPNYYLIAIAFLVALASLSVTAALNGLSVHAFEKHGEEAILVMQCLTRNGAIQIWEQPNGRLVRVCQFENGKFGIEITENGNNVTAFVKNKLRTLAQVEKYLKNRGARLLWSR